MGILFVSLLCIFCVGRKGGRKGEERKKRKLLPVCLLFTSLCTQHRGHSNEGGADPLRDCPGLNLHIEGVGADSVLDGDKHCT